MQLNIDIADLQDTESDLKKAAAGTKLLEFDEITKRLPELIGVPADAFDSNYGKAAMAALQAALAALEVLRLPQVVKPKVEQAAAPSSSNVGSRSGSLSGCRYSRGNGVGV